MEKDLGIVSWILTFFFVSMQQMHGQYLGQKGQLFGGTLYSFLALLGQIRGLIKFVQVGWLHVTFHLSIRPASFSSPWASPASHY